jgi:hypothetical protein
MNLQTSKRKFKNRINKYNNIFIERVFLFLVKKRIDNDFLIKRYYNLFAAYQYLDKKTYTEPIFRDERNHYIPVFILNNFRVKRDSGEIYQYEKNGSLPFKGISISKEAANYKNYYATTKLDDGRMSNYLEKSLFANLAEKFGSLVFDNLLKKSVSTFTALEENIMATHAAFQYVRTPAFFEQVKVYMLYLIDIKKVPRETFSNNGKEELRNIFESNSLKIEDNDVRDYYEQLIKERVNITKRLSDRLENSQSIAKFIFIVIGASIIKFLFDKKKTLIDAEDPFFFVLPDAGCVVVDVAESDCRWPFGWNFIKDTKILLLPLSPGKCLVFHGRQQLDFTLKELFRNLAIGSSYYQYFKYVYSDRKNKLIQMNLDSLPN